MPFLHLTMHRRHKCGITAKEGLWKQRFLKTLIIGILVGYCCLQLSNTVVSVCLLVLRSDVVVVVQDLQWGRWWTKVWSWVSLLMQCTVPVLQMRCCTCLKWSSSLSNFTSSSSTHTHRSIHYSLLLHNTSSYTVTNDYCLRSLFKETVSFTLSAC